MCITFAQPLIALPFVNDATSRFSDEFKCSVHAYFSHEDPFPFIMRYFSGSQGDNHDRVLRPPLSTVVKLNYFVYCVHGYINTV